MDKKEIIIDGVDVGECEYRDWRNCCHCDNSKENEGEERITGKVGCEYNPNCHFKQLKRKEQECEELRQYHNKCCKENIEKLEQWLEKYNQLSRDFYNGKCCNKENCSLLKAKEQECENYKQALDEIEKIVVKSNSISSLGSDEIRQIQNIINKAKRSQKINEKNRQDRNSKYVI